MPTLIYTPAVQVVIESAKATDPVTGRRASYDSPILIDVSDDLVEGNMSRRSDGVSTFNFSLINLRRKYDYIFSPNDRLYVRMKRLNWLHVFTGYLNSVPLFSVWPRTVEFEASCSLKRLQYFYWDAALPASQSLVMSSIAPAGTLTEDGGIANAAKTLLTKVVGWPEENIHISDIPANWFDFAAKIATEVAKDVADANQVVEDMIAATGTDSSGSSPDANAGTLVATVPILPQALQKTGVGVTLPTTTAQATWFGGVYNGSRKAQYENTTLPLYNENTGTLESSAAPYYCILPLPFFDSSRKPLFKGADQTNCQAQWKEVRVLFTNPANGRSVVCKVVGWQSQNTASPFQLSPKAFSALIDTGATPDTLPKITVGIVGDQGTALGPGSTTADPTGGSGLATVAANAQGTTSWQNFMNWAIQGTKDNIPYEQVTGAPRLDSIKSNKPSVLDCSSFVCWAYWHSTGRWINQSNVKGIIAYCQSNHATKLTVAQGLATAGAVMTLNSEHTEISCGDGKSTIGEHHTGTIASRETDTDWTAAWLLPGLDYTGAGAGAQYVTAGGQQVPTSDSTGAGATTPSGAQLTTAGQAGYSDGTTIGTLFSSLAWSPSWDADAAAESAALVGVRALLNDEPIGPYIKNLMNSSMRSFCSAPNGDYIAWFPDYYGLWGTAGKLIVEPIELIDFTVDWSDDFFVTHQYVSATQANQFALGSGGLSAITQDPAVTTVGIATIDIPSIMTALFGSALTDDDFVQWRIQIYERFGPRPDFEQPAGIQGPKGEFFYALFLFMRQWAYQYNANVSLTFMPEAYPGMLVQVPAMNFQAYITTVSHSFAFGPSGSFRTTLNIAAPATLNTSGPGPLVGLPVASANAGLFSPDTVNDDSMAIQAVQQGLAKGVAAAVNDIGSILKKVI